MNTKSQKVFFVSDLHFNHSNIIKYCNRPYSDIDEMNADIIRRWNAVVGKNDIVWNLGDFIFAKKSNVNLIREFVTKLNGFQFLILGNHDRRISKDMCYWYDCGFTRVYDKPILFQDQYILSHEPVSSKYHLDLTNTPLKNIHGHIHNSNQDFYDLKDEDKPNWNSPKHQELRTIPDVSYRSFNVSLEVINYTPIRWEQIVDAMNRCHGDEAKDIEPPNVIRDLMKRIEDQKDNQPVIIPIMPDDQKRILPMTSDPFRDIPEACKHCSNRNPDGTYRGPCMCTLGTPPVMC